MQEATQQGSDPMQALPASLAPQPPDLGRAPHPRTWPLHPCCWGTTTHASVGLSKLPSCLSRQ